MALKSWSPKGFPPAKKRGNSQTYLCDYEKGTNKITAMLIKILLALSRTAKHLIHACFIAVALNKFPLLLNFYYFYRNKL